VREVRIYEFPDCKTAAACNCQKSQKLRNCINGREYKTLYNFWKPSLKGYVGSSTQISRSA
jgi:hypothetical protein